MNVIEFQTYIDHGTIELPKEYHDRVKGRTDHYSHGRWHG